MPLNVGHYEAIESHLLCRMLQTRKQCRHASESDPEKTAALEAAYKYALHLYHDFVSKGIVPEDLLIPDSGTDSNEDKLRTKGATEELLVEEIGFEMLSPFFGSQTKLDSRVGQNRRSERRIDTQRSPALLSDGERFRVPVVILDVSSSGLGILTKISLPTGNGVLIELNDDFRIYGTVMYCRGEDSGADYSVGIKMSKVTTGKGTEI